MRKKNILLALMASTILIFSCKKENLTPATGNNTANGTTTPTSTLIVATVKNLPANPDGTVNTQSGHYTLFSFKNNATVSISDSATTKWDIGFNSTTILVNGGTSGPGAGSAQVITGLYDNVIEAPASGYSTDNKNSSPTNAIPTGSGNGWYNYNSTTHIISAIPGRVLAFTTADGKYAKIEIISYYKDMPANPSSTDVARYYTFRYSYQDDGTKKFQ